ncbi:MAG: hypothetical protein IT232_02890 [Flavobacteriales bacterium]|nr:hypothetical protein [Flavobacteriales bacterium]
MKKSVLLKVLSFIFVAGLLSSSVSLILSCSNKPTSSTRNGGKKVSSSGHIGNKKHKNSHVWGK